jgi:adenylyl cyclase-associated protein
VRPTQQAIERICEVREKNRPSPFYNHLSTVSEGIPAFGWISMEPAPAPYITEMKNSAMFYADRVKKEFKDKDKKHVEWANSYLGVLESLHAYVKEHHTTGLVWSLGGVGELKQVAPPVPHRAQPTTAASPVVDRNALFSALNKGEGITAGLKKVHKEEAAPAVPKPVAAPVAPVKATPTAKGPPRMELEANKWIIENYTGEHLVLNKVETQQVVYIYNCNQVTIKVNGKVTAITMDKCIKTGLVMDSVVANAEVIHCKNAQLQVVQSVPTITVDNTDGFQLFLSPTALDVDLITSKSTSVNVNYDINGDYVEKPVSEQFLTKIVDGSVVTAAIALK